MTSELAQTLRPEYRDHTDHLRFDVLRGLMAILVMVTHAGLVLVWRLTGEFIPLAIAGKVAGRQAVIVFFLLSGFLITRSVRQNIARHGHFMAMDYVTSRLARIYPPLIGAVLLCGLIWALIHGFGLPGAVHYGLPGDLYTARDNYSITLDDLLSTLAMQAGLLGADGSLWTLYLEVHLYTAVLAFVAWRATSAVPRILCLVVGLAGLYALRFAIPFAFVWLIGALFEIWPQTRRTGLILAAIAAVPTLAILIWEPNLLGTMMDTARGRWAMLPPAMMIGALLFAAPPRWRYPRALVRTGDYSYSLYVIHWPLLLLILSLTQQWTQHSLWRAALTAIAAILMILPLSMLFASVAEQPKRFARILRGTLSGPPHGLALSPMAAPLHDRT